MIPVDKLRLSIVSSFPAFCYEAAGIPALSGKYFDDIDAVYPVVQVINKDHHFYVNEGRVCVRGIS